MPQAFIDVAALVRASASVATANFVSEVKLRGEVTRQVTERRARTATTACKLSAWRKPRR
jgi:hypothetical protein